MAGHYYDASFPITSLTGSLLWALNYAYWLRRQRYEGIQIFLVDIWKIPVDRFYPAQFLAEYLDVPPLNMPWHDDPYHEYFVFGGVPSSAILGSSDLLPWVAIGMHTLLPALDDIHRNEGLLQSLHRLQMGWIDGSGWLLEGDRHISRKAIAYAYEITDSFLRYSDKEFRFPIAMMFLSLRRRDWDEEAWVNIQSEFKGVWLKTQILCQFWTSLTL